MELIPEKTPKLEQGELPLDRPNIHIRNVIGKLYNFLDPTQLGEFLASLSVTERVILEESRPIELNYGDTELEEAQRAIEFYYGEVTINIDNDSAIFNTLTSSDEDNEINRITKVFTEKLIEDQIVQRKLAEREIRRKKMGL